MKPVLLIHLDEDIGSPYGRGFSGRKNNVVVITDYNRENAGSALIVETQPFGDVNDPYFVWRYIDLGFIRPHHQIGSAWQAGDMFKPWITFRHGFSQSLADASFQLRSQCGVDNEFFLGDLLLHARAAMDGYKGSQKALLMSGNKRVREWTIRNLPSFCTVEPKPAASPPYKPLPF